MHKFSLRTIIILNCLVLRKQRFQVVDIQNATLSGGVAVGAIADLMLQPGGAFVMGTITGMVSAFGYRVIQVSSISSVLILSLYDNFHNNTDSNLLFFLMWTTFVFL